MCHELTSARHDFSLRSMNCALQCIVVTIQDYGLSMSSYTSTHSLRSCERERSVRRNSDFNRVGTHCEKASAKHQMKVRHPLGDPVFPTQVASGIMRERHLMCACRKERSDRIAYCYGSAVNRVELPLPVGLCRRQMGGNT